MKKLLFLIIPVFIYGNGLKELIEYAEINNNLVVAKSLNKEAQSKNIESKNSAYLPTLDAGGFYQSSNEKPIMEPGDVYSAYAKIGFDIYDGGKKSSLLEQAKNEYKASEYDSNEIKKSLSLKITRDFYSIKSLKSSLVAKEDAKISIKEQLSRIKKYYEAGLATIDDIDRLQAAYDTNIYEIESLKFDILTTLKSLELKVGKKIDTLDDSSFTELVQEDFEHIDGIKALMAKESALMSSAESIESAYYPQIRLEDTYSLYGYDRTGPLHPEGLDNQNKIILSANIRLYDFGMLKEAKESAAISSQALGSEVTYKIKEQKMQHELALLRIQTSKMKIKSASSAMVAAKSAFKTINEKYSAGIVDYVIYLDALTSKTNAKALYETALNELQTAYGIYYYYSAKDLKEFLK